MRDPRQLKPDAASPGHGNRFLIGSAELRLESREIRFDGVNVDVQPKVLDLLAYLVIHRDRVVSKDELFDHVWPSVIVSDASLSQTVKRVRDLFRSQGFEGDIIRTVARRGYQFQHAVIASDTGSPAATPELSRVMERSPAPPGIMGADESAAIHQAVMQASLELRGGFAGALRAEELLQEVLEHSPDHHPALLGRSEALRRLGASGARPRDEAFRESLMLAEKAVRSAPENGLAYLQLAELRHRHFWDFAGARESFEQALKLMPDSGEARAAFSRFLAKINDNANALEAAREALRMDPQTPDVHANLILRLVKVRKTKEAQESLELLRALHPAHGDLPWLEGNILLRDGCYRQALQLIALEELDHLRMSMSAIAYHHLGRTAQAARMLNDLVEADADGAAFQIAEVHASWGAPDEAFGWLEQALQNGDPGMAELYSSFHLEPLQGEQRFARIAEQVGLPAAPGSA